MSEQQLDPRPQNGAFKIKKSLINPRMNDLLAVVFHSHTLSPLYLSCISFLINVVDQLIHLSNVEINYYIHEKK